MPAPPGTSASIPVPVKAPATAEQDQSACQINHQHRPSMFQANINDEPKMETTGTQGHAHCAGITTPRSLAFLRALARGDCSLLSQSCSWRRRANTAACPVAEPQLAGVREGWRATCGERVGRVSAGPRRLHARWSRARGGPSPPGACAAPPSAPPAGTPC